MKMVKRLSLYILMLIAASAMLFSATVTYAADKDRGVTPYGDFCKRHSPYGAYHKFNDRDDVLEALRDYYGDKGLTVKIEQYRGRFVKVIIMRGDEMVDRVLLDTRTHRLRSIK